MKPIIFLAVLACAATTPSFAKDKTTLQKAEDIHVGQTREQIQDLMGKPGDRSLNGSTELWQYCGREGATNKFIGVFFKDGSVIRMDTYHKPWLGPCNNQYRTFKWGSLGGFSDGASTSKAAASN